MMIIHVKTVVIGLNYDAGMENRDIMSYSGNEGVCDGLGEPSMKQTSSVLLSRVICY